MCRHIVRDVNSTEYNIRLTISYASAHAVAHEEFNLNTSVVKNKGPLHTTKINHPLREKNYVGLVYVLLYTKEAITWF